MFGLDKLRTWLKGKEDDDTIRSVEDLRKAVPELRIFTLPELPQETDLRVYRGEEDELQRD